jgi:diguanylate cyclase (GGDEF)-like protein/PAS domain S-box-containing protein
MKDYKNIKVLYVEDDVNTSEEVSQFLRNCTDILHVAFDGKQGLDMFKEHRPNIIITDIQMPVMDGLEMIRQIKEIDKDIFVVVVTAFNEVQYLHQAINLGINKYFLKPLDLIDLALTIEDASKKINSQTLFHSLDADGKILTANQAWLDYLGFEKEEVIGKPLGNFMHESSLKIFEDKFESLKLNGQVSNVHYLFKKRDGTLVDIILNATSSYDENNKFVKSNCELRTFNILVNQQADSDELLLDEKYLKSLLNIQVCIIGSIIDSDDKKEFLQDSCNAFVTSIHCEFSFIALLEQEDKLEVITQSNKHESNFINIVGETLEINEKNNCPTFRALYEKDIVIVDDIEKFNYFLLKNILLQNNLKSILSIPIVSKLNDQPFGVITLVFKNEHYFKKEELLLFNNISETIAFGLQTISDREEKETLQKILQKQAKTDTLTQCANRYGGKTFLENEIDRAKRYNRTLSLIYFDIDDFKKINDNYGHDVGDLILKGISTEMQIKIRSSDLCVRWGGEEFLVILPESNLGQAINLAEKLRVSFKSLKLYKDIITTSSFGVVEFDGKESLEKLVSRADALMYKVKKSTKDKVLG